MSNELQQNDLEELRQINFKMSSLTILCDDDDDDVESHNGRQHTVT